MLANVPRNGRFLYSAVNRFPPDQVMAFFEALGVPLKTERGEPGFSLFRPGRRRDRRPVSMRLKRAGIPQDQDRAVGLQVEDGRVTGVVLTAGDPPGRGRDPGHRRPFLSRHRLHRGRLPAWRESVGHTIVAAQGLPGAPGRGGGDLRPDAGAFPEKRDPHA